MTALLVRLIARVRGKHGRTVATPRKKWGRDLPHMGFCSCSTWIKVSCAPATCCPAPTTFPLSLVLVQGPADRQGDCPHDSQPMQAVLTYSPVVSIVEICFCTSYRPLSMLLLLCVLIKLLLCCCCNNIRTDGITEEQILACCLTTDAVVPMSAAFRSMFVTQQSRLESKFVFLA